MSNTDLTKCHPTKSGNIITCQGRGAYVFLFKARGQKGDANSKLKYSSSLLFPAGADLDGLKQGADDAVKTKWGGNKPPRLKSPFLKTADHVHNFILDDNEEARAEFAKKFPTFIRCASEQKPDVLFANGEKCDEEAEAYSGRWMRFSVRPYAWDHPANGKGVSFGLQNVQLLEHADRFAGGRAKAEDEFAAVKTEGGSSDSMGWE